VDESTPDEEVSTAPANPLTTNSDDPSLLPRLALVFSGGGARQQVWLVDRSVTLIGRASFCKVRLHSPLVSQTHASLVNTSIGPWVVDLLGREGISVNGMSVRWARLEPEDEIGIDQFRIRLHFLAAPTRALQSNSPFSRDFKVSANVLPIGSPLSVPVLSAANSSLQALPPTSIQQMNGSESLLLPLISQFSLMQQQMFDQFQQTLLLMAQTLGNLHREQMALVRQELDHIQDLTRQLHTLQLEEARPASPPRPTLAEPSMVVTPPADAPSSSAPPTSSTLQFEGDVHAWLSQRLEALQQERQSRWQKVLGLLTGQRSAVSDQRSGKKND
jgi:hypothetical protein